MLGIILFIACLVFVSSLMGKMSTSKRPCWELKKPHKWVYRGEEGSEYMVCSECLQIPGGGREESIEE